LIENPTKGGKRELMKLVTPVGCRAVMCAIFAILLVVPSPAAEEVSKGKPIDLIEWAGGKFLYGTYYYPDHWPEEMWERDAQMMQAAGINLIKTGEGAWVTFEPAEGRFDFSWMDRAIQVFSAHGNQVHPRDARLVLKPV
jgi:hypothetical protein